MTTLATILAAVIALSVLESRRIAGTGRLRVAFGGVVTWAVIFGLCGMLYWVLLDSVIGALGLPVIAAQIEQWAALRITFGAGALPVLAEV